MALRVAITCLLATAAVGQHAATDAAEPTPKKDQPAPQPKHEQHPEHPAQLEQPQQPHQPEQPENPEQPEQPKQPEQPEQPEQPKHLEQDWKKGLNPATWEKAAEHEEHQAHIAHPSDPNPRVLAELAGPNAPAAEKNTKAAAASEKADGEEHEEEQNAWQQWLSPEAWEQAAGQKLKAALDAEDHAQAQAHDAVSEVCNLNLKSVLDSWTHWQTVDELEAAEAKRFDAKRQQLQSDFGAYAKELRELFKLPDANWTENVVAHAEKLVSDAHAAEKELKHVDTEQARAMKVAFHAARHAAKEQVKDQRFTDTYGRQSWGR